MNGVRHGLFTFENTGGAGADDDADARAVSNVPMASRMVASIWFSAASSKRLLRQSYRANALGNVGSGAST
jgi:hypothetical protein